MVLAGRCLKGIGPIGESSESPLLSRWVLTEKRFQMNSYYCAVPKFIAMMKDFVKSHETRNATTESFKSVVEKYMTPAMDLEGNHRMDWFFRDWVYGTEIPRYRLEYTFASGENGQTILKGKLTQSGVSDGFLMSVPLYVELPSGTARLGLLSVGGNRPKEFQVALPIKPKRVFLNANQDVLAYEASSVEIK